MRARQILLLALLLAACPAIAGTRVSDLTLRDLEGRPVALASFLEKGPVVLVVFKTWCSTSTSAIPFYEKLAGYGVPVLLVGHNTREELEEFRERTLLTAPLLEDPAPFAASRALNVRATPTLILIGSNGDILDRVSPWNREGVNRVSRRLSEMTGRPYQVISRDGDGMPDNRPG